MNYLFKKMLMNTKLCFDFLYKFCMKIFSFWEELSKMWSKMNIGLHVQYSILLKYEFSLQIFEKHRISNFLQIRPVGAELFPVTDGQTWRR